MFGLNVRFQLAALIFVCIILFDFFRSRKIPTAANKHFKTMLILTTANLVLDISTVYTVNHTATVPETLNLFLHRCFYVSISAVVFAFYRYIHSLDSSRNTKKFIPLFASVLFGLSVAAAAVLDIYFHTDSMNNSYSMGMAVNTMFILVGLQLATLTAEAIISRIPKKTKMMILTGIAVWSIACLVQLFVRELLLTGLGNAIIIVFVYLSLENPAEYIDRQTGAYNRFAFDSVLREKLRSEKSFYVINVVMDELNMVIARFGYGSSRKLMYELGEILTKESDGAYLIRDNSFTIFSENGETAKRICKILEKRLSKMWMVKGTPIFVKGHADVLAFPDYAQNADEINEILKYAGEHIAPGVIINIIDENCVSGYRRETEILYILREAVKQKAFDVYYQPIYNADKKAFTSAEALVRLSNSYPIGYISPDEFIPIAEKNGLIMEIGELVLTKVCKFASEYELMSRGIEYVEVNISGVQIVNNELPEQISSVLDDYHIPPSFINLEITETASVESQMQMKMNLTKIKNSGCSFSLDDFGTGYSNLSKIADSSFDIIKLDKSLIWPCFDEKLEVKESYKARVIMYNVISMIKQLDIEIVAEGVETEEQAQELISKGVTYLQGYHYSRPITAEAFDVFLREHSIQNQ